MNQPLPKNLKLIRFEGQMLPEWAQLLDLAARLCPVPEDTRSWFSTFTASSGVADARTVVAQSKILLAAIREHKNTIIPQLQRSPGDGQASRIFAAWEYALDTMMQEAFSRKTCSWQVEGFEDKREDDHGDGNITLRRV